MNLRQFFIFACLIAMAHRMRSQEHILQNFSVKEGMASSVVYRCMQDADGFMWFATENGVTRYDGFHFDSFTTDDGLPGIDVINIDQDSHGRIWFFTVNGHLSYYYKGKFYNEATDPLLKDLYTGMWYQEMYEDPFGNLWFCSVMYDVAILGKNDVKHVDFHSHWIETPDFMPESYVNGCFPLYSAEDSTMYIHHRGNKLKYDYATNTVTATSDRQFLNSRTFRYLSDTSAQFISDDGTLVELYGNRKKNIYQWLETVPPMIALKLGDDCYTAFNDGHASVTRISTGKTETLFDKVRINYIFNDREGNIWMCSRGEGVFMLGNYSRHSRWWSQGKGFESECVQTVTVDKSGNIWCGLEKNNRIVRINDHEIKTFDLIDPRSADSRVLDIVFTDDQKAYIATDIGMKVLNVSDPENVHEEKFRYFENKTGALKAITEDHNGILWYNTSNGLCYVDRKADPMLGIRLLLHGRNRNACALVDQHNRKWISFFDGLYIIPDPILHPEQEFRMGEPGATDLDIIYDSVVVATYMGMGLVLYRNDVPVDTIFNRSDLNCDVCKKVFTSGNAIWCATNKGIRKISITPSLAYHVTSLSMYQGLPSPEVNSIWCTSGYVYAGTNKGLIVIPESNFSIPTIPVPVYIRKISGSWGQASPNNDLELSYLDNNLLIEFSAISISGHDHLKFQYAFDADTGWSDIDSRSLQLRGMPYGAHVVSIRTSSGNNVWSEPALVRFHIHAPFWQSTAFRIFIFLLVMGVIGLIAYVFTRRKINRLKQLNIIKAERERISGDLHDDIGADLTRIALMAEVLKQENEPTEKDNLSEKIISNAKDLRLKADQIIWALNPAQDNAKDLVAYIHHYGKSFFDSSGIAFSLENKMLEPHSLGSLQRRNLFLIFKEAMNNALKHSGASMVTFSAELRDKNLYFSCSDNGIGCADPVGRSGMRSMERRASEVGGKLTRMSSPGNGLTIVVEMPAGPNT